MGRVKKRRRISSVYFESEEYKELKTLDAADRERAYLMTDTDYALHDAREAGDLELSIRVCKDALEKFDAIGGQPSNDKIVRYIRNLENYNDSLVSQSMSSPSSE